MNLPGEDKSYLSKKYMLEDIVVFLAGRIAEDVVFDDVNTGASNDIERATKIARDMVTKYGMSDTLGPIMFGTGDHEVFLGRDYNNVRNYSEAVAAQIDEEVKKIITYCYDKCKELIITHRDQLNTVAEYLFENEKVDGATFEKLMKGEIVAEQLPVQDTDASEATE